MIASAYSAPARIYHVAVAVWGPAYVDLFLSACLPNQLSARNLPSLPAGSRYRIFTRASDVPALAASTRLNELRAVMPVDIVDMDDADLQNAMGGQNRYKLMTLCHRRAATDAAEAEAAIMFLAPDFMLAEGTLEALVRLHARGSRAVLSHNLRLTRAEFVGALRDAGAPPALPPRDLVRLALRHLHPSIQSLMVDGSTTNDFPTSVWWPVRSADGALEGLLARSLHLHPMLIDPLLRDILPRHTTDGHYVHECCPDLARCHVVQDSDELVVFELTPVETSVNASARRSGVSRLRLAAMAATCDAHQLSNFQHPIRLHSGALDARWPAVEEASARFALELERYRPAGRVLIHIYRLQKTWRRRADARVRAIRRSGRDLGRAARRTVREAARQRDAYVRAVRRVIPPRFGSKQIARPAKVLFHRAAKAGRLGIKRIRRRVRLFRPA